MLKRVNKDGKFYFKTREQYIDYTVYFDYIEIHTVINTEVLNEVVEECWYWYPYVSYIKIKEEIIKNKNKKSVFKVRIDDIVVEQLTVDENKLRQVSCWIKEEKDIVVGLVQIDDNYVCIDGYSRLMQAYLLEFKYVYAYLEESSDFIRICRQWCIDEDIHHISDLESRIVNSEEHQRIWVNRCQKFLKNQI